MFSMDLEEVKATCASGIHISPSHLNTVDHDNVCTL